MFLSKRKNTFLISFFILPILMFGAQTMSSVNGSLKTGDSIPVMKMEDIDGNERNSENFSDGIIVYSFGDRESNKPLQEAVMPAGKKVLKAYPELKITYVNIADLQIVPSLLKYMVEPFLKYVNDSNMETLKENYQKEGLNYNDKKTIFYLIPDWDGDHCRSFKLKDAEEWCCFITYRNRVYAVLNSATKDFSVEFIRTIDTLSKQMKSGN